jgi:hypothetical protein
MFHSCSFRSIPILLLLIFQQADHLSILRITPPLSPFTSHHSPIFSFHSSSLPNFLLSLLLTSQLSPSMFPPSLSFLLSLFLYFVPSFFLPFSNLPFTLSLCFLQILFSENNVGNLEKTKTTENENVEKDSEKKSNRGRKKERIS